jgi:hypothetical protein
MIFDIQGLEYYAFKVTPVGSCFWIRGNLLEELYQRKFIRRYQAELYHTETRVGILVLRISFVF